MSCTIGPFEPLKLYLEQNLTKSRGFDDASYLPQIALYSGAKRRTRKIIRRQAKKCVKKQPIKPTKKVPTMTQPFICGVCVCEELNGFKGKSLQQLAQHLAQAHQIRYNIEHQQMCSFCRKNYRTRCSFLKHTAKVHPEHLAEVKRTLHGLMHIDVLELMLVRVGQAAPVIVELQPAEFTSSLVDAGKEELQNGCSTMANWDISLREEEKIRLESKFSALLNHSGLHHEEMVFNGEISQVASSSLENEFTSSQIEAAGSHLKENSSGSECLDLEMCEEEEAPFRGDGILATGIENTRAPDSSMGQVLEPARAWCKFCRRLYRLGNIHMKERRCSKCSFVSVCALQFSNHLLLHQY